MVTTTKKRRRLLRWIAPRVQGRALVLILMIGGASVVTNVCVFAALLAQVATELPSDGELLYDRIGSLLLTGAVFTLAITAPITAFLGLASLMPILGPLYRFRVFLGAVDRGEHPQELKLRSGDPFQDVAELLNRVSQPKRTAHRDETLQSAGS